MFMDRILFVEFEKAEKASMFFSLSLCSMRRGIYTSESELIKKRQSSTTKENSSFNYTGNRKH